MRRRQNPQYHTCQHPIRSFLGQALAAWIMPTRTYTPSESGPTTIFLHDLWQSPHYHKIPPYSHSASDLYDSQMWLQLPLTVLTATKGSSLRAVLERAEAGLDTACQNVSRTSMAW